MATGPQRKQAAGAAVRTAGPAGVLAWLLVLLAWTTAASASLQLPAATPDAVLDVTPHLEVLEDRGGQLQLEELLLERPVRRFAALGERSPSFGLSHSAWWLRFELHNPGVATRFPVLRQDYPMLDRLDVWVVERGRVLQHWQTGDRLPFSTRPLEHRDFLFPLVLAPDQRLVLYVRAQSEGPVNVPMRLYAEQALLPRVSGEQLVLGALFGSFLLLATCIALLYLFVRDASFLYYLCYILCYGSYMAVFNGLAYQYVLPDSPELASVAQVVLLMLALHFLLLFSRSILRIPGGAPQLDLLYRLLHLLVLTCLLGAPFIRYGVLIKPISLAIVASMLLVIGTAVLSYRAGQAAAGWFLLAWSAFVLGVLVYMCKSFGWLPHNTLTQYGFQIGTLFEFVLLSVALGFRVRELKQQSRTDALTGLANRSRFDELIEQQFAHCHAIEAPLALLVIDVDHFKQVNDQHGHLVGDRVLQRIALLLQRGVPRPHEACRYGGEEFAVVLPRVELAAALELAEALRDAIATDTLAEVPVTISAGVACTRGQPFADPRALFRAADEALYEAKRHGRNRALAYPQPAATASGAAPTAAWLAAG